MAKKSRCEEITEAELKEVQDKLEQKREAIAELERSCSVLQARIEAYEGVLRKLNGDES